MMKPWTTALLLAIPLALAGCNKDKDDSQKATASGELLPRSVSDDMLPYDTVRSQPTLASPEAAADASGPARPAAMPEGAGEASGAPGEAPPPAPASSPLPSPSPT